MNTYNVIGRPTTDGMRYWLSGEIWTAKQDQAQRFMSAGQAMEMLESPTWTMKGCEVVTVSPEPQLALDKAYGILKDGMQSLMQENKVLKCQYNELLELFADTQTQLEAAYQRISFEEAENIGLQRALEAAQLRLETLQGKSGKPLLLLASNG